MKIIQVSSTAALMAAAVLLFFSLSNVEPAHASHKDKHNKLTVPVGVTEGEFFVTPFPTDVAGGHFIMFNVTNVSPFLAHEFVVIRLKHGQTYDNLPISTNPASEFYGRVDEDALGHEIKGAIEEETLPPGASASLTVGLPPGDYALICNLPGHYFAGMRSAFNNNHHRSDHADDKRR